MPLYSPENDPELAEWLRYQADHGSNFVRALVEVAKLADYGQYYLLQPVLRALRAQSPEPGSSIRTLTTDEYTVVFTETDKIDNLDVAFARYNAAVFDNGLPETKIRYATSIRSLREPLWPIGALALPTDRVTHLLQGQLRLDTPHIFISEKLRGVAPVDEWVLLHEMCHFKVPHHGAEFVAELKRVLDAVDWRVLLGGAEESQ